MNIKHFRNQTNLDLTITLQINQGFDIPAQTEITHTFRIRANEHKKIEYGDLYCNYLSGISITYELDGMRLSVNQTITNKGSSLANTLNESSYIGISSLMEPTIDSDV